MTESSNNFQAVIIIPILVFTLTLLLRTLAFFQRENFAWFILFATSVAVYICGDEFCLNVRVFRRVLDIIHAQEHSKDLHEQFHSQLDRAQDGFSVIAEYFSRGVFNKVHY